MNHDLEDLDHTEDQEGLELDGATLDEGYDDDDDVEEIVAYQTVAARTAQELDEGVASLLEQGWQPYGSLVVTPQGELLQPMTVTE